MDRRVTVIRGGGGRTVKGAREGVNVQRGADNDERGYRLILIMESVQVKRSIFPPAHVHPFSNHPHPLLPSSSLLRSGSPRRPFLPL